MKIRVCFLLATVWLLANTCTAATAQARLFCLSLRFQTASTKLFGQTYTLDFMSDTSTTPPNGELFPLLNPAQPSHATFFQMHDPTLGDIAGTLVVDVPSGLDTNTNGFNDFFESSQAIDSVTTTGNYNGPVDEGSVTMTWQRDAGATAGTCKIHLESAAFGPLVDFTATFGLLEFSGPLTYLPGATNVTGTIQFQQTGSSASLLGGDFQFLKVSTNRFNMLALQPGGWTNASAQTLNFTNDVFQRDVATLTNYFGFVDFADGDPASTEADYQTWILSIDDPNDANANQIPDFSDDPAPSPGQAPRLTIAKTGAQLELTINGEVGRLHELQAVDFVSQTNWTKVLSLALTNDPQIISLPFPTNSTKFWRAKVP